MYKNKTLMMVSALALAFLGCMLYLVFTAGADAAAVQEGVLRFHIVAASDSEEDQQLKLKVRDGIATLTDRLFADADSKAEAIARTQEHKEEITAAANEILRQNGSAQTATVEIKNLYFPTKQYDEIFFPAGHYDAIHITLGEGKGENFWCVMFPALCVPSVSQDNARLLSAVLEEDAVQLVTRPYSFKFKTAEWLGKLTQLFK